MSERISAMLQACATTGPRFPPTELYNEAWLLRLLLDWFSTHSVPGHPLSFGPNAQWFSEAQLPSAFQARYQGDPLSEARSHADGVIGHFAIGGQGKTDLSLLPNASQFVVLEAKMLSGLSRGTKHAPYFDQAARTVACMAETLRRAERRPSCFTRLAFHVLAPADQLTSGSFSQKLDHGAIQAKVERRVHEYAGEKDAWYADWFQPTFQATEISALSWEALLETIGGRDEASANPLWQFYERCIEFSGPHKHA